MPKRKKAAKKTKEKKHELRNIGTRQSLLDAQGPKIIELPALPVSGMRLLMRRVLLLELAGAGTWPQPITARIVRIMTEGAGEQVAEARDDAKGLTEFLEAAAAIARACIVEPPEEYLNGEVALEDLDPDSLTLLFTDEFPTSALHVTDLQHIATLAFTYGPGALRPFRPT